MTELVAALRTKSPEEVVALIEDRVNQSEMIDAANARQAARENWRGLKALEISGVTLDRQVEADARAELEAAETTYVELHPPAVPPLEGPPS